MTGAYAQLLPASKLKLGLAEKKLAAASEKRIDVFSALLDGFDFSFDADVEIEPYEEDGYYAEVFDMLNEVKLHGGKSLNHTDLHSGRLRKEQTCWTSVWL